MTRNPPPTGDGRIHVQRLDRHIGEALHRLPYSLRILAESCLLRGDDGALAAIMARNGEAIAFRPRRLLLQDMLGLPMLLDIMALADAIGERQANRKNLDLSLPVDLVIDHSMTLFDWAGPDALRRNQEREFALNRERFEFFRACETRFSSLRIIPPGGGIMHQVNLEYLATVVEEDPQSGTLRADTVLGTDSHTPMVNGLGVLGWGIGGLDAERIALGGDITINVPNVVGVSLQGHLPANTTATDLALSMAELLRREGVIGQFVELFGAGYCGLSVPDRATVANMAPEFGATCVFCPIDDQTIRYLRETGRGPTHIDQVGFWARQQSMRVDESRATSVEYDRVLTLNLCQVTRSVAGPSRPEQRIPLSDAPRQLKSSRATPRRAVTGRDFDLGDGDVVIAAITSCTNTANPRNMILAGLLARNAVANGIASKPWVKTSLAPGSRAVATYLRDSGLQAPLDRLGFHVSGFACTTCNGMSGPLAPEISECIGRHGLDCAAVLSGNRNFPGRIHPDARVNLLASPPLVIAYALSGKIGCDITQDPLGTNADNAAVRLSDLWPDPSEVDALMHAYVVPDVYRDTYRNIRSVSPLWSSLDGRRASFNWPAASTYITRPPFLDQPRALPDRGELEKLRVLAVLGDNVTTDHISPAGYIPRDSAAGHFLLAQGIAEDEFNSYGTRRGCNEIVVRSTFASVALENALSGGRKGSWTRLPDGELVTIHHAIEHYRRTGEHLVVVAGRSYGAGSSRDTAAKAPWLAGVRVVIAESFERIHRSNLINMGVAPLLFADGATRHDLRLSGTEMLGLTFDLEDKRARLSLSRADGTCHAFRLEIDIRNSVERETLRAGGLLRTMLAEFATEHVENANDPACNQIRPYGQNNNLKH